MTQTLQFGNVPVLFLERPKSNTVTPEERSRRYLVQDLEGRKAGVFTAKQPPREGDSGAPRKEKAEGRVTVEPAPRCSLFAIS